MHRRTVFLLYIVLFIILIGSGSELSLAQDKAKNIGKIENILLGEPSPVYENTDRESATIKGIASNLIFQNITNEKTVNVSYAIVNDENGQTTIEVTGVGATVSLADIQTGIGNANLDLLQNVGTGIWQLNANLSIGPSVTLNLSPATNTAELRLRSQSTAVNQIDYASFVYLRTYDGIINLNSVRVYSWDATANTFDINYSNGRAYVLAKYNAVLNIQHAEISYLGSADNESYGITWRDINDPANPTQLRTRVTGQILNNRIHHNYSGISAFQASNMVLQNNEFSSNALYGLNFGDFSHDITIQNNLVQNNGGHGLNIGRGCNNVIVRNNGFYGNSDYGVYLTDGANQNLLQQNLIHTSVGYGIGANGTQTVGNTWSQNSIYANQSGGINLIGGANLGLSSPTLLSVTGKTVKGNASAGATVEIFADTTVQGRYFEGQAVAAQDGQFSLTITENWQAANLTAITIDSTGNASTFSVPISSEVSTCYNLITSVNPSGGGTITSSPQPNCQDNKYQQGTVVSLSASAGSGYTFSHWSGAASGNANPLSVTINGDKNITANFNQLAASPTVQFSASTYTVLENNGFASIEVTLSTASERSVTMNYSTSGNTATAGSDYSEVNSILTFNPGETRKSFTVPIIEDALDETDETLNLSLGNPSNATLGPTINAILTIIDNESGTWIKNPIPGTDAGAYPSIDMDSIGGFHISYYRVHHLHSNLWYVSKDGIIRNVDLNYEAGVTGPSLAVDSTDKPHIIYQEGSHPPVPLKGLKYARLIENAWVTEIIDSDGTIGHHRAIALDGNNTPHITYYALEGLIYGHRTESGWITETVDSLGGWGTIVLDNSENPYIAYSGASLRLAHKVGGRWSSETITNTSNGNFANTALVVGPNRSSFISFIHVPRYVPGVTGNIRLLYAYRTENGWVIEKVDEGLAGIGGTSLALDHDNNPHISYSDSRFVNYARRIGGTWLTESIDGNVSDSYPDLVLDKTDTPHIVYSLFPTLKHAYKQGQGTSTISGRITDGSGNGLAGVNVNAGGPTNTSATTDSNGNYILKGLASGDYVITPSKSDHTFSPISQMVTVPPDVYEQNFVGVSTVVNPLPVILVHGWNDTHATWGDYLSTFLPSIGLQGYAVDSLFTGHSPGTPVTIDDNAKRLEGYIARIKRETNAKQVDIVAHSMGGLIARRYIAGHMNSTAPDVHQLIMIGTPNRGSRTAALNEIAHLVGINFFPPSPELTEGSVANFNNDNSDHRNVPFYVIAGNYACISPWVRVNPYEALPNDLLVSVDSALGIVLDGGWVFPGPVARCDGHHRYMLSKAPEHGGEGIFESYVKPLLQGRMPTESTVQLGAAQAADMSMLPSNNTLEQLQFSEVQTRVLQPGTELEFNHSPESTLQVSFVVLGQPDQMIVKVRDPNGQLILPDTKNSQIQYIQMDKDILPFTSYTISNPITGIWTTIVASSVQTPVSGVPVAVLRVLKSEIQFNILPIANTPQVTYKVTVLANLKKDTTGIAGAVVTGILTHPNNTVTNVTLFDDGLHNDSTANDGIYAYQFIPQTPGLYRTLVSAEGTYNRIPFHRIVVSAMQVDGEQIFLPVVMR